MKWLWKLLFHWSTYRKNSLQVEKLKYESFAKQCDICIKKRNKIANNYYKRF